MARPLARRPTDPYDPSASMRPPTDQDPADNRLWTADELPLFEGRCELVDGRIVPLTPPGEAHGRIGFRVALALGKFVERHGLGACYLAETGFLLSRNPDTVRAPDFAFVGHDRLRSRAGYGDGAPNLVVEVTSPNDAQQSADAKARMWIEHGVELAWVVDPDRREVRVFARDEFGSAVGPRRFVSGGAVDGGSVLPGFTLAVDAVFRGGA